MASSKKNKEAKYNKPDNGLLKWLSIVAIAIITYFVFSPSLQNDFTNWDDPSYVTANPLVVNNTVPLKEIISTPVSLNYHPLTILTLAWNYQSGRLNPMGYHLENILLHILNTILVFFFILMLTRQNLLMASFVALFFGIHPMHVESVSWVSERKDVLYVFFFLAGLITYLKYSETKKILWYGLTLLFFVLSCLSKGMAVVFPVILLLIDYLQGVKWEAKVLIEKTPFFIIALAFGIPAYIIQSYGLVGDMPQFNIVQRVLFASYGAVMYIVKLFLPLNLSSFYPYPVTGSNQSLPAVFYLYPVIFLAMVLLAYFFLRKERSLVFGLLFYFVSVVLVLQFISVGNAIMADRYTYLSYIGLLFACAYLLNKTQTIKTGTWAILKFPALVLVAIGFIAFSIQTYARTQVWKNSDTLWTDVINKYPASFRAYETRGQYYEGAGEEDKAMNDFKAAINFNPDFKFSYLNRGIIYYRHQQYNLALADYNKAISIDTAYGDAYFNKAIVYYDRSKLDSAITLFAKSVQLNPANDPWLGGLGQAYMSKGKYDRAIECFSKAIQLNPSAPAYWFNRSRSENVLGRKPEAKNDALKAQQLGMEVDVNYLKELGLN